MIISKNHLQCYLAHRICGFAWYYAMKNRIGRPKILVLESHTAKSVIIQYIDAATPVHEDLGELISSNLRCHHQSQLTRIIHLRRVILSTPCDWLFQPPQIPGRGRFNIVNSPFPDLLVPFVQASGKHMVLATIQLLRMALIARLLLLPVASLTIVVMLIVLPVRITMPARVTMPVQITIKP